MSEMCAPNGDSVTGPLTHENTKKLRTMLEGHNVPWKSNHTYEEYFTVWSNIDWEWSALELLGGDAMHVRLTPKRRFTPEEIVEMSCGRDGAKVRDCGYHVSGNWEFECQSCYELFGLYENTVPKFCPYCGKEDETRPTNPNQTYVNLYE